MTSSTCLGLGADTWVGHLGSLPHASSLSLRLSLSLPCGHTSFSSLAQAFLHGGCLPRSERDYTASISLCSVGQSKSKGQHRVKRLGFHSWWENDTGTLQRECGSAD